mgnify:CR=1 FL=1
MSELIPVGIAIGALVIMLGGGTLIVNAIKGRKKDAQA